MIKENIPLVRSSGKKRFFHILVLSLLKFFPFPEIISGTLKLFFLSALEKLSKLSVPSDMPIKPSPFSLICCFMKSAPKPSPDAARSSK